MGVWCFEATFLDAPLAVVAQNRPHLGTCVRAILTTSAIAVSFDSQPSILVRNSGTFPSFSSSQVLRTCASYRVVPDLQAVERVFLIHLAFKVLDAARAEFHVDGYCSEVALRLTMRHGVILFRRESR